MPLQQQNELSDEEFDALAFGEAPDQASGELSPEEFDAIAFGDAPAPQAATQSFPSALAGTYGAMGRNIAGTAVEGLGHLAGYGSKLIGSMDDPALGPQTTAAIQRATGRAPSPQEPDMYSRAVQGAAGLLGQAEQPLRQKGQEIFPQEERQQQGMPGQILSTFTKMGVAAPLVAAGSVPAAFAFAAQEAMPAYYDVLAKTGSEEKANKALWGNSAIAQLNFLGGGEKLFGGLLKRLMTGKLGTAIKNATLHFVLTGGREVGTEVAQTGFSDLLHEELTQEDIDNLGNLIQTAKIAGIVSGPIAVLDATINRAGPSKDATSAPQATQAASPKVQSQTETPEAVAASASQATTTEAPAVPVSSAIPQQEENVAAAEATQLVRPSSEGVSQAENTTAQAAAEETVPEIEPLREKLDEEMAAPEVGTPEEMPEQPTPEEEKATGIKNRTVAKELEEMGLPPVEKGKQREDVELHATAKEIFERKDRPAEKLVDELERSPRATTDEEGALLTFEANRLRNERKAAEKAFIEDPSEENKVRVDKAIADYKRAADVFDAVGTQSGRGLRARQLMLKEDYSLAAMERALTIAKGGQELTAQERAKLKEQSDKIERLTKERDELVSAAELRRAEAEADKALAKLQGEAKSLTRRSKRRAEIEQAKKELGEILDELGKRSSKAAAGFGGLDAQTLALVAKAATKAVKIGAKSFVQFSDIMVSKLGEGIRPYLQQAWVAGQQEIKKEVTGKITSTSNADEIGFAAHKLALMHVESGVSERGALVKAVHEDLKAAIPGLTLEDARDAISGYGRFKPLAPGEAKAKLMELKGQLQQVAKLEAIQNKQAIKKSGLERPKPGAEQKSLIKKVKAAQRFLNLKPVDIGKARDQALASVKSRMRSQINELEAQIDSGQKKVTGAPVAEDAEVKSLREYRDQLKEQYDHLFPKAPVKRGLTDEQRIEMAIKATQRSIADIEQRLKTGDVSRPKAKVGPTNPQLEALRAERDARRAELEFLRAVNEPQKTPEERALKAYKARITKQEAKLRQQMTFMDFSKEVRKKVVPDKEATEKLAELESTKKQFEADKRKAERAQMTSAQKALEFAYKAIRTPAQIWTSLDFSAVLRQGLFYSVSHPFASAKKLPSMFGAMFSERAARKIDAEIRGDAMYPLAVKGKLELTELDGDLGTFEENLRDNLAERIPVLGRLVRGSNRGFITYLNLQRMYHFKRLVAALPTSSPTMEQVRAITNAVNVATGRGNPGNGKLARSMEGLATVLWSPRLYLARLQLLVGQPLYRKGIRKEMLKDYARFLIGMASVYALAELADELDGEDDVKVSWNPTSSDFGKFRVGRTRIDPLGGLSQFFVFGTRTATGEKTTKSGQRVSLGGDDTSFMHGDWYKLAADFIRSKLAPIPATFVNWKTGKTMVGEKVTTGSAIGSLFVPLSFGDIREAIEEQGIPKGAAMGLIGLFGAGLTTHKDEKKPRGR